MKSNNNKRYFWLCTSGGSIIACRSIAELRMVEGFLINIGWRLNQCSGQYAKAYARRGGFATVREMVGARFCYWGWQM